MDMFAAPQVILLGQNSFGGISGFLPGARGSLMLDVVFVALFVVLPVLAASIYFVKARRHYRLHKSLQLWMAGILFAAIVLFELDIRVNGWEQRAAPSPYFDADNEWTCPAGVSLIVHLSFAIPTLLLWAYVVAQALRKFSRPPEPGLHSRAHALLGWAASLGMLMTALTGWIFYWLAFVAS
jgi:hypothetical protein